VPGAGASCGRARWRTSQGSSPFRIDWHKEDRAPLLILGGGSDHVVPPGLSRSIFKHYQGPATVEYHEFPGRSHYTCGQDGWEEVADFALTWATEKASPKTAR
jgi:pimeloyl-ACP methyl ester carboxylesterase